MNIFLRSSALLFLAFAVLLTGCRKSSTRREHFLRVGVISGAEEQVAKVAQQIAWDKYHVEIELVTFNDYAIPNAAVADGSIDLNAFQHRPFLDQQIKDRGYKLAVVGNTFVYPIAAYSQRIKSLAELKDGATLAIPNDPTNLGRALLLLQKEGLLRLKPEAGAAATRLDITANPHSFKIVELEAPQLPRALPDVDLAIINTTFASQVGLSPTRDGLFVEDRESPYVNLIVARTADVDNADVKAFVRAYQTEEVFAAARSVFHDGVVKGW